MKSRRGRKQPLNTAKQQARAYQQHQGNRHLRDDQHSPHQLLLAGGGARALLQSALRIAARHMQRWNNADDQAHHCRDRKREEEYRTIELDGPESRKIRRAQRDQHANSCDGQRDAESSTCQRQQQAFSQQLL